MNQTEHARSSSQRNNVKRVSAVMQVLINIGMAFTGIGIAISLIGIFFSGSLRTDLGDGKFEIHMYREAEVAQEAQLLIVAHEDIRRDGLLYQAPSTRAEPPSASVPVSPTLRGTLLAIALLNGAVVLHLLGQLAKLFGHYERGEIFTRSVVNSIRATGLALLAFPAVALINSIAGVVLVKTLTPQLDFMDISINVNMLFAAVLLLMVSWIMDEGRKLHEESALTI
jgi:hypothetical protein